MNRCYLDSPSSTASTSIFAMKKASLLKKRTNDRDNEVKKTLITANANLPNSYGDRFIPRRKPLSSKEFNCIDKKSGDLLESRLKSGYWRLHNFKLTLNTALNVKNERFFKLTDCIVRKGIFILYDLYPKIAKIERFYDNKKELDWECNARIKPVAIPDSTHDLPGFSINSHLNIIAWSASGQIAASFGNDLVLWTPNTENTIVYKINIAKALAYNPKGDLLAIGSYKNGNSMIELWDVSRGNVLHHTNDYMFSACVKEIRCIEWDPAGEHLVCGTENGELHIFFIPTLKKFKNFKEHRHCIFAIKFSPKMKYLAVSDVCGNICIFLCDSFEIHVKLSSQRNLKTMIDWHPWHEVDLVIAEDLPASIVILNVPAKKIVAYYQRKDYRCRIESLIFSKRSGELVVSFLIKNLDGPMTSEILVMASLDRIVDVLKTHESSVKFMIWSPDGSQLATAGDDDLLTIWNFFSVQSENNKYLNLTKKSNIPNSKLQLFVPIK